MNEERRRYRINWVAEQTGISETTLRAWERRYGVPEPARTPSGYRIYSVNDVEKVRRMRELCAGGMSPSEAALAVAEQAEQAEPRARSSGQHDELRLSETLGPEHVGPSGAISLSGVLLLMERGATALASLRLRLAVVPMACGPIQIECAVGLGETVTTAAWLQSVDVHTAIVEVQLTVIRASGAQSLVSGRVVLELPTPDPVST